MYEAIAFGAGIGLLCVGSMLFLFAWPALRRERKARYEAEKLLHKLTAIQSVESLHEEALYLVIGRVQSTSTTNKNLYVVRSHPMTWYHIVRSETPLPERFRCKGGVVLSATL